MTESAARDAPPGVLRWVRWGLVFAAVAVLVPAFLHAIRYDEAATFRCPHCLSTSYSEYHGVRLPGIGPVGGTPRTVEVPSALLGEVFAGRCTHSWPLDSHTREIGGEPASTGVGSHAGNPLSVGYETSARFRDLVRSRLADGSLKRDRARALFSLPAWPSAAERIDPAVRLLLDEAEALLRDGGLPPHSAWAPARPPR